MRGAPPPAEMSGQDPNARTLHAGFLRKPDFKRMQQLDLLTRLGRVNSAVNEKAFASSRWFSLGSDGFLHYGKDERSVNKGTKGRKGYIKVHTALIVEDSKVADAPLLAFDIVCPKRVYTLVAEDPTGKMAWVDALRAQCGTAYASKDERASVLAAALVGRDEAGASPRRPSVGLIRRASIRASFTLKHHAKVVKHAGQASRRGSAQPLARRLSSEILIEGGEGASYHSDEEEYSDAEGDDEASSRRTSGAASPTNAGESAVPPLLPPRPQSPAVAAGAAPSRPQSDQFDADVELAAATSGPLPPGCSLLPPMRRASKESAPRRTSSTSGGASSDSDSSLADGSVAAPGGDAAIKAASPASDLGTTAGVRNSFKGNYSFQNATNTSSRGLSQRKVRRGSMGCAPSRAAPDVQGAAGADGLPVSVEDDTLRADLNEEVAENIMIQVGLAAERELARTQALGASQAIAKTIVAFRLHVDALMAAGAKAAAEAADGVETDEAGAPAAPPGLRGRSRSVLRQARRRRSSGLGTNSWVPDGWGDGLKMVRWETVSYEACFGADDGVSSYAVEVLSELLLDDGARPELATWLQGSKRELNTIASRLTASMRGPLRAARVSAAKAWHMLLKLYSEHAIALKLSDAAAFDLTAYESLSFLRSTGATIQTAELEPLVEIALDLCVPPSRQIWRERAALLLGDAIELGPAPPESIDAFGKTLVNVATIGAMLRIAHPIARATAGAAARDGWALAAYAVKTFSMLLIHAKSAANVATILGTTEGDTFLNWMWPFFTCIAADKKIRENSASSAVDAHSASAKAALKKDSANAAQIYTLSINAVSAVLDAIVASHGDGVGPYCRAMAQSLHRYSGWGRSETKLFGSIVTSVFAKIAGSSKTWRHDFTDPRWTGVAQLLETVLDFAFSAPHAAASLSREAAAADAVARYSAMPVAVLTPRDAPDEADAVAVAQRAKEIASVRPLDVADVARWDACAPHVGVDGKCMDLNLVNNALRLLIKLQFDGEASVTSSYGADERATIKKVATLKGALERARDCFVVIDAVPFDVERVPFEERAAFAAKAAGSASFYTRCKTRRAFLKSPLAAQPPAALWRVLRGSSDDVDKASEGLGEAAALKYTNRTAAGLHQMWCESRNVMADGTFEPRIKTIDGVTMDIANMHFDMLPVSLQSSNVAAAKCACRNVEREFAAGRDIDSDEFMEEASELQHENWIENNRSWADAHQLVPYTELSHEDKEKDRAIVRVAIKEYGAFMSDLYAKIIIAAQQSNILTGAVKTMFKRFRRASSIMPTTAMAAAGNQAAAEAAKGDGKIDETAFGQELAKIIESLRKTGALCNEAGLLELNPATIVALWESREAASST